MADADTVTFTVEGDGDADQVTLPAGLVDLFAEAEDTRAEVVGDIALTAFVQRIHSVVHHSQDEPGEELRDLEAAARDRFEDRFGLTFEEATGHSH